jgi:lauroyl/myristoyl acyltransferase
MITLETPKEERKIYVKRRGNKLGIWFFEILLETLGLKGAYFLLEFVCLHYLIFDREAVHPALIYIQKRFPEAGILTRYWHVHRLFVNQGRQLIDRYAITRKPEFFRFHQISSEGAFEILQESQKGVVLLMSHAGNWQVALRQMGHLKKQICIVIRPEDNAAIRESLQISVEAKPVQTINPEAYLGGVLEMMQALREGHIVCIMGDRSYGFDTVEIPFLGQTAYFPYGAFLVAASVQCPVIPLLTHKISEREYIADLSNVWYPVCADGKNKKEQLKEWVGKYVQLLEEFVKKHPYECFLFHNVWSQDKGVLNEQ